MSQNNFYSPFSPFSTFLCSHCLSCWGLMWNKFLNSCSLSAVTCVLPDLAHPLIPRVILISTCLLFPVYPSVKQTPFPFCTSSPFFSFPFTFPYVSFCSLSLQLFPLYSRCPFFVFHSIRISVSSAQDHALIHSPHSRHPTPHRLITQ